MPHPRVIPIVSSGELSLPNIPTPQSLVPSVVGGKVEIQLFTTLKCNIRCSYCVMDVGDVLGSQGKASYPVADLERFIATHLAGKEVYFTFFGGEPLLNMPFIDEVMATFPRSAFQLQTNGTLLSKLPDETLSRFSNILISVDGGQAITDKYRGRGVFSRVMDNVAAIRSKTQATLTARMTWCDPDTSFEEMDALLAAFDWVHFQFAQQEGVYERAHIEAKKRVIDQMVHAFYAHDGLYRLVPLMGIARNLAIPGSAAAQCSGSTQCRVSTNLINVRPDGRIFGCPDMTWDESMEHGSVTQNRLARSPLQQREAMPCGRCEARDWCRGNCLKNLWVAYVLDNARYRASVVEPVCELVRHLGRKIAEGGPAGWIDRLAPADRALAIGAPIYDFVEIIP